MNYIGIIILPGLVLGEYFLSIYADKLRSEGYSDHFKTDNEEFNPVPHQGAVGRKLLDPRHLLLVVLFAALAYHLFLKETLSDFYKLIYGMLLMNFVLVISRHITNIFLFRFIRSNPQEIKGQVMFSRRYVSALSSVQTLSYALVLVPLAILSRSYYIYGAITGFVVIVVFLLVQHRYRNIKRFYRYILIVAVAAWICSRIFSIYLNKTYSAEEIEKAFVPITSKYGIKIVYEIGDDFFSPLENSPIPAGPPRNSTLRAIRHRVLMQYPEVLQKAFDKYPIEIVRKHLDAIQFAGEIDADGFKFGGTYDPFRQMIYLVDNGKNENDAVGTIHHEFSSLLLKSRSFFVNPWTDHHPEEFKYLTEIFDSWKTLDQTIDFSKEATERDFEKGFVSVYGQTNFENDFNEYSEMILTFPQKFKMIMDHHQRVRGKFKVWLDFYQKIDPVFTEAYLFGENLKER